jgi:hypothetical protein
MTVNELIQEYEQRLVKLQDITNEIAEQPDWHWERFTKADRYTTLEGARIMETSYNRFLRKLREIEQ